MADEKKDPPTTEPTAQRPASAPKQEKEPEPPPSADDYAELKSALSDERKKSKAAEVRLAQMEQATMSDRQKEVAEAKAAGRSEALLAAGKRLAAAEFRAAAAGKLADPSAALDVIDLAKFVAEDGEPDTTAISKVVDKLASAAAVPSANGGRVPAGPRSDSTESTDWVRAAAGRV
jgi:hypothetical protein